jgi:excinuclease ABC subunit C
MHKAAQRLDFERAAELRDMVESFKTTLVTTRSFERGARIRAVSTIDPMADVRELAEELKLERMPLVMECFDIANIGTAHCVASMVCFRNGVPDPSSYRRYRIKIVSGQNDFASMAEVVRRRYSRLLREAKAALGSDAEFSQEEVTDAVRRMRRDEEESADGSEGQNLTAARLPDLVIVDGGKGQLGMAVTELQRLGLHDLAVVGLAKDKEEVFKPGESESYQIPHDRGALKLLQRIRDEAHRWANGYHQLLLKRRVRESVLDDCPGVSKTRKASLLRVFGSVAQLRKASVEDIAKVPGIGKTIALSILQFLESHQVGGGETR